MINTAIFVKIIHSVHSQSCWDGIALGKTFPAFVWQSMTEWSGPEFKPSQEAKVAHCSWSPTKLKPIPPVIVETLFCFLSPLLPEDDSNHRITTTSLFDALQQIVDWIWHKWEYFIIKVLVLWCINTNYPILANALWCRASWRWLYLIYDIAPPWLVICKRLWMGMGTCNVNLLSKCFMCKCKKILIALFSPILFDVELPEDEHNH